MKIKDLRLDILGRKTAALKEEELEKVVGGTGSTEEKTDGDLKIGTDAELDDPTKLAPLPR